MRSHSILSQFHLLWAHYHFRYLRLFDMPSGSAASATNLENEVQETGSEIRLSLTAQNPAPLLPTARLVNEQSAAAQGAVDFRRLDISGSQVLIGFLLGLCLVGLFVAGVVRFWLFAR